MDNSLYIVMSRQMALFRDMEVTANNIANTNTTGYNSQHIMFESYLVQDINSGERNKMAFPNDIATYRNTSQGTIKATGNPLDVAIKGDAFFAVETPLGTRYTRAGNFQIDGEGTLVTAEGYPVLDNSNQRIVFPEDAGTIEIGSIGNIKVNDEDFATLSVVEFENPYMLEPLSGGLFASDLTPTLSETASIQQGVLENSNVVPVIEMTRMMEVSRAVGSTSKFIELIYDMQRKASNTWAQQG